MAFDCEKDWREGEEATGVQKKGMWKGEMEGYASHKEIPGLNVCNHADCYQVLHYNL